MVIHILMDNINYQVSMKTIKIIVTKPVFKSLKLLFRIGMYDHNSTNLIHEYFYIYFILPISSNVREIKPDYRSLVFSNTQYVSTFQSGIKP